MENITEFKPWPKISRWSRDVTITEKLDGTSSCVVIDKDGSVFAQSRNRIIYPHDDNYGFARWVETNRIVLVNLLGEGYHYGEWWGRGIQRGYGMTHKQFSLFNVSRWETIYESPWAKDISLGVVPLLWKGPMDEAHIQLQLAMQDLKENGSKAAPGFKNPEGVVLFHSANGALFKKTFEKDEQGKGT